MVRILFFLGLITLVFSETWQEFIQLNFIGSGFQHAAILGTDGSVWATSTKFSLKVGESAALVSLFERPEEARIKGITVGGVKYLVHKADYQSIHGQKRDGGIVIEKNARTIIIGVYNESLSPGTAANLFEKYAMALRGKGF